MFDLIFIQNRKYCILLITNFLFVAGLSANPADSVSTKYQKGEFTTFCQVAVTASDSISNEVITKFVYQMCYDLDGLFKWGLKGMSLANGKNDLLIFDFKATKFDKKTSVLRGIGDVVVPGVTVFPNLFIDSRVTQKKYTSGRREVRLDLASENSFIKQMIGVYRFVPKANNHAGYYSLETHIRFNWFFDIFITQNRYKKIMEWRLKQLLKNMKEESEKREIRNS